MGDGSPSSECLQQEAGSPSEEFLSAYELGLLVDEKRLLGTLLDDDGEEDGEAADRLAEKVRARIGQQLLERRASSAQDAFMQQQAMDGTMMKKDGRHTSSIGSWKLSGPVGCEVMLYNDKNLEGDMCHMTIDKEDGYNNQPYDDVVECEDMELCCPFDSVSSVEVLFNEQVAKMKQKTGR